MTLPDTMNAWVMRVGEREPVKKIIPVPKPEENEVLVKIEASGVCHSDCTLLAMDEAPPTWNFQKEFVLGHEGAGTVVQLGSAVDSSKLKVGDRVGIFIIPGCDMKSCNVCNRGLSRLCREKGSGNYGLGRNGFFAEYVAVQSRAAIRLPDAVSFEDGAVSADAVLTAYYAVKYTAAVQPEQTIVIYGLGGVGLNALQTAMHVGVKRILVVDKRQETIDAAIKLGITAEDAFCTSDANRKPIHEVVAESGILVDTSIDLVGHDQTILSAQMTLRPAGKMVIVGLFSPQAPLIPMLVVCNNLTIQGSYSGSIEAFHECLHLMARGVLKPSIDTGSIEDVPKILKDLDDGKIRSRMVLLPDWRK